MLCEETVILDGVADSSDLLNQVISAVIHQVQGVVDLGILMVVVVELDGAWILIVVILFPGTKLSLHLLEWLAIEVDILTSHNEVSSLESSSWMRSEKG